MLALNLRRIATGANIVLQKLKKLNEIATAYIHVFGAALGFAQDFRRPMAKQHLMAVLTAGCLVSIIEHFTVRTDYTLPIILRSDCRGFFAHLLDAAPEY